MQAQTIEECPGNGSNVKRMAGRIANDEEAKEWGQIELEATLIGARRKKSLHSRLVASKKETQR